MDLLLFRREEYDRLYSCVGFNASAVPPSERQRPITGSIYIVFFILYELPYIPCLFFIAKRLDKASYKFMFFIGITDVLNLPITTIFSGYHAIKGTVFCNDPTPLYLAGVYTNTLWYQETTVTVVLALSRFVETVSPVWGRRLFLDRRAWLWVALPTVYGFYFGFVGKPTMFSGVYATFMFNPFQGYSNDKMLEYENFHHTLHNASVAISLVALYVAFIVALKAMAITHDHSSMQNRAFVQVIIICTVNCVTAIVFLLLTYVDLSKPILLVGHLFWIHTHGLPGLTYIAMNKTMRQEFYDALKTVSRASQTAAPQQVVPFKP